MPRSAIGILCMVTAVAAPAAAADVEFGRVVRTTLPFPAFRLAPSTTPDGGSPTMVSLHSAHHAASITTIAGFTFANATSTSAIVPSGASPMDLDLADMNLDGRPDLVVCSAQTGRVSITLANADGTHSYALGPLAGAGPVDIATGDLDGDGDPDVATANQTAATFAVLWNDGAGSLSTPLAVPVGGQPSAVAIADLDRDGYPEVLIADAQHDTVAVFALSNNAFVRVADLPTARRPSDLLAADLDGDGRTDLAVANAGAGNVRLFRGRGDGTLEPGATIAAGPQPGAMAIGDLDLDGRPDLIVPNLGDRAVALLRNRGQMEFTSQRLDLTYYPAAAAVIDANGDGTPDLAIAPHLQPSLELLEGLAVPPGGDCPGDANGNLRVDVLDFMLLLGTFGQTVDPGTGGDINGDGRVDVFDLLILMEHYGLACAPD